MQIDDVLERAREVKRACDAHRARMPHRNEVGRPFEEHWCHEMPHGYALRRYGLPANRFDRDCLPTFVWAIVRTEFPDFWIDGDRCQALVLNGTSAEPRFCPWCGERLDRADERIRGWDGRIDRMAATLTGRWE